MLLFSEELISKIRGILEDPDKKIWADDDIDRYIEMAVEFLRVVLENLEEGQEFDLQNPAPESWIETLFIWKAVQYACFAFQINWEPEGEPKEKQNALKEKYAPLQEKFSRLEKKELNFIYGIKSEEEKETKEAGEPDPDPDPDPDLLMQEMRNLFKNIIQGNAVFQDTLPPIVDRLQKIKLEGAGKPFWYMQGWELDAHDIEELSQQFHELDPDEITWFFISNFELVIDTKEPNLIVVYDPLFVVERWDEKNLPETDEWLADFYGKERLPEIKKNMRQEWQELCVTRNGFLKETLEEQLGPYKKENKGIGLLIPSGRNWRKSLDA